MSVGSTDQRNTLSLPKKMECEQWFTGHGLITQRHRSADIWDRWQRGEWCTDIMGHTAENREYLLSFLQRTAQRDIQPLTTMQLA